MKINHCLTIIFLLLINISCEDKDQIAGPTAKFGYVVDDLNVVFIDSSEAGDGIINQWVWDFGDGTSSLERNPTHSL